MNPKDVTAIVDAIVSHERFDTLFTQVAQNTADIRDLKTDVADLKDAMRAVQKSIDHLATTVDTLLLEYASIKTQQDRHERWFRQLAAHVGVELVA